MVKIDWEEIFRDYSFFGWWKAPDYDHDDNLIFKWEWQAPVNSEPWHGCHRIKTDD